MAPFDGGWPATHVGNLYWRWDGSSIGSISSKGSSEVFANPLFVNAAGRDYRLQPGSPAIAMGASLGYATDFAGTPIPTGSAVDVGAYQHQ
jgi:hypothetical protein